MPNYRSEGGCILVAATQTVTTRSLGSRGLIGGLRCTTDSTRPTISVTDGSEMAASKRTFNRTEIAFSSVEN
jgi:hypothetical protein